MESLKDIRLYTGTPVILPVADILLPSKQGILEISKKFSQKAQTATVLPHLKSASLISLGQISNDNCTIVMNKQKLITAKSDKMSISVDKTDNILTGTRNKDNVLYNIPVPTPEEQTDNYFIQQNKFKIPKLYSLVQK